MNGKLFEVVNFVATTHPLGQKRCRRGDACRITSHFLFILEFIDTTSQKWPVVFLCLFLGGVELRDFKINILGTEYAVYFVDKYPERLHEFEETSDGLFNQYNREIFIKRCQDTGTTDNGKERLEKKTLRHELIHAFLAESGLSANALSNYTSWAENEEMVDWIAIQFPKILEVFKEADCL